MANRAPRRIFTLCEVDKPVDKVHSYAIKNIKFPMFKLPKELFLST